MRNKTCARLGITSLAVALLAVLPWVVLAQNEPPQVFIGTAVLNGAIPPSGTEITARDGSREVGSTYTKEGGKFKLQVSRAGETITFTVGGVQATETAVDWTSGHITRGFNLTATAEGDFRQSPGCQSTNHPIVEKVHFHEPPHVFIGQAFIGGQPVAMGTEITAWDGDAMVGSREALEGGWYSIQVARSYGSITFQVAGLTTPQTYPSWTMGQVTRDFNLSAPLANCLQGIVPVKTLLNAVAGKIVRIFSFDNGTKQWQLYDPAIVEFSDLTEIVPGKAYYILVSESFEVNLNGTNRRLTCLNGNCWNQIVW